MIPYPNFMFINHKLTDTYQDLYGKDYRRVQGVMNLDFVFIQEENGTFTVYKNRLNGVQHTGWTYEQCLDLIDECLNLRLAHDY